MVDTELYEKKSCRMSIQSTTPTSEAEEASWKRWKEATRESSAGRRGPGTNASMASESTSASSDRRVTLRSMSSPDPECRTFVAEWAASESVVFGSTRTCEEQQGRARQGIDPK